MLPGDAKPAPCAACLERMFDPADCCWQYAFTSCRHCKNPSADSRQQLIQPCSACLRTAARQDDSRVPSSDGPCPRCGPHLDLQLGNGASIACDRHGDELHTGYAIAASLALLRNGAIIAIESESGVHLCCDARNAVAITRLRAAGLNSRPMAVMAANLASLAGELMPNASESEYLQSRTRPVLALQRHPQATLPASLAPGEEVLAVTLPFSALYYLLFHASADAPSGIAWLAQPQALLLALSTTDQEAPPAASGNSKARSTLARAADAFLIYGDS